jgi:hypothetical protein
VRRWSSVVLGALVVAAVALAIWGGARRRDRSENGPLRSPVVAVSSGPLVIVPPLASSDTLALTPPDPTPVRPLPAGAPKAVHFGVVLVQYRGAQFANEAHRSKGEAYELARSLTELARHDFKAAVKKGDPGSVEDAGRISRGILESGPEFAVFTLSPNGVSDPIDTPRGYWIARRID